VDGPPPADGPAERSAAAAQVFVADPVAPVLDEDDARHLVKVLRLRPGEVVVAADGRGGWCRCRFRGGTDPAGLLEPDGEPAFEPAPVPALTVAFAPAKGDRPEWVVQKLCELGIDRIVPVAAARSVVRWEGERAVRAAERLGRVAREAAAQSRRVWLPEVAPLTPVTSLVEAAAAAGRPVRLAQRGGGPPQFGDTAVAVGPEGGWAPEEAVFGAAPLGLGPTVLRAETAAVAVAVVLVSLRAGTVGPAHDGRGAHMGAWG
jgi:16S rRNA (uracil1498-N3)-methyltransferase